MSRAFARLDPISMGVAVGAIAGVALAGATLVLLLKDTVAVGPHLARIAWFVPGYSVSFGGAFVGLLAGSVIGFGLGNLLALIWNGYHRMFVALAVSRERGRDARRELMGLRVLSTANATANLPARC